MKLKRPLPSNRTLEQITNHYTIERAIASRLKVATREDRKLIYSTMYDDLFRRVPDHPRLTRRKSELLTLKANRSKFRLVRPFLDGATVFAEFAAGDCKFAFEVAKHVSFVYAIEISNQCDSNDRAPDNFRLIIYDGYDSDELGDASIDVVFSDQLVEHLHPEDTVEHFRLAYRILRSGGVYVFRTPHYYAGPHDVSAYFSDEAEGFHLKEWCYSELKPLLKGAGFRSVRAYSSLKGLTMRMPWIWVEFIERSLRLLPRRANRLLARWTIPSVNVAAIK